MIRRTDGSLVKDPRVEHWDVDSKWDARTSNNNGPEQDLVRPQVLVEGPPRSDIEHTPIERLELPSEEQDLQDECGENGGTGAEHICTIAVGIGAVALGSEITTVASPHDHDERDHNGDAHNKTVVKDIDDDLDSEDSLLDAVRWTRHDAGCRRLQAQTKGRRARRDHVDPENGQGREREDAMAGLI